MWTSRVQKKKKKRKKKIYFTVLCSSDIDNRL